MNPHKIVKKRILREWRKKYQIWRTAVDWTVALYILLPLAAWGVHEYQLLWERVPNYVTQIPFSFLLVICYLFAWSGTLRVYVEEADQLFLNNGNWVGEIMKWGLRYSILGSFTTTVFFFFLLAPLLLQHYQLTNIQLLELTLLTFLFKVILGSLKQLLSLSCTGLKFFIFDRMLLVLVGLLFVFSVSKALNFPAPFNDLLLLICAGYAVKGRLEKKGAFLADVEREKKEKLKHIGFLLDLAGTKVKKPKGQRKWPWLFLKSRLLFRQRNAVNGLVEVMLKSTLRNGTNLGQYVMFVLIGVLIMVELPVDWGWLIGVVLVFMLMNLVGLYWKEVLAAEFLCMFSWSQEDKFCAAQKFLFLMSLPGSLLISFMVGWQILSWTGGLAGLVLGTGLVYYLRCKVALYLV